MCKVIARIVCTSILFGVFGALPIRSGIADAHELPDGFVDELMLDDRKAVGVVFDANGRMYLWEKKGVVWLYDNWVELPQPLINLSDEVGDWRDFGCLGFALDPEFLTNGYFYLYYVVDRYHLLHSEDPDYDPSMNEYFAATIGRITRYTADPATNFTTVIPGSRQVLLGETLDAGPVILHESHGVGTLLFGEDGTLLASSGDGASYTGIDAGSRSDTYWSQALADGMIRDEENVGSFRSQMLHSLSGKILRLDRATGDGVPSNPYYDPANPRSAASRTWTFGLRNPCRMALRPGTGFGDAVNGHPGTLYLGDVGWDTWEEANVVVDPGTNLGWPLFEGLEANTKYQNTPIYNRDARNPLYDGVTCADEFLLFQDLIKQEQADHNPYFPNPCDPLQEIPAATPTFVHTRPAIEWRHKSERARVGTFVGNDAATVELGDPNCPVTGTPFKGECSIGGVWHSGESFPPSYGNSYFQGDFSSDWIQRFVYDEHGHLEEVHEFAPANAIVFLTEHPAEHSLLYIEYQYQSVHRIRYTGDTNAPPVADLQAQRRFGSDPMTVRFDGSGSVDPEGDALTYSWNFGDGTTSTDPAPTHTFRTGTDLPTAIPVTLTVFDSQGLSAQAIELVHVDNTPPSVAITSFVNGSSYSTSEPTILPLEAAVTDAEHDPLTLTYAWQTILHHNEHEHPEPIDENPVTSTLLSPTPCDDGFFTYEIVLTVTDPLGLSTTVCSWLVPDCSSVMTNVTITSPSPGSEFSADELVDVSIDATGPVESVELRIDGEILENDPAPPFDAQWTAVAGEHLLIARAVGSDGSSSYSPGVPITVKGVRQVLARVKSRTDDATESTTGAVRRLRKVVRLGESVNFEDRMAGFRFRVDVPPGADILRSTLTLEAASQRSGPEQRDRISAPLKALWVVAEAADDSAPIGRQNFDLSLRPMGSAVVHWIPGRWQTGATIESPDLARLLQEIVDRPDWYSGNHVLLLFTGTDQRAVIATEGALNESSIPTLAVEYR